MQEEQLRANHISRLHAFFSGLRPVIDIAEQAQIRLDRYAATGFSVFEYFSENEMALSRVFADLLNPKGRHGQGDRFLQLFLEGVTLPKKLTASSCCQVYLEQSTEERRRVDIVLQFTGNEPFVIGIENKPWAADQDEQIASYIERLSKEHSEDWTLLYLSGDGSTPSEHSIERKEWEEHCTSGRCGTVSCRAGVSGACFSVEEWLEACRRECEAERVRWFLKDCLDYIRCGFTPPEQNERSSEGGNDD